MAQFTISKHICGVNYKTKNLILDSQLTTSSASPEKSKYISVVNGKTWSNATCNSNNTIGKSTYIIHYPGRDTLPLFNEIIPGRLDSLNGQTTQPTIAITCRVLPGTSINSSGVNNNSNLGNILPGTSINSGVNNNSNLGNILSGTGTSIF